MFNLNKTIQEHIEAVCRTATKLQRLTDDIIDFTRIESHTLTLIGLLRGLQLILQNKYSKRNEAKHFVLNDPGILTGRGANVGLLFGSDFSSVSETFNYSLGRGRSSSL
jgi:hypothetical protein